MNARCLLTVACLLVAGTSSAQIAVSAPKPDIAVTATAVGSLGCGQAITRSYTIKNTGTAALSTKVVINGIATPFSLAKGEEKTVTANGGTYDCKTSLVIKVTIPNPYATGTLALPLWSREHTPGKVSYGNATVAGVNVSLPVGTCGAPPQMKFTNNGAAVAVKAQLPGGAVGGTVGAGSTQTYTGTANLECSGAAPAMRFNIGTNQGELQPVKVGF